MNDNLKHFLEKLRDFYGKLSGPKKIGLIAAGALVLCVAVVGGIVAKHDPYQLLYSDLQPEESRAVAKKLSEQKIPYQISEDRGSVSVQSSQVATARMQLAKDGLPGQDVVGFEKFDGSTIGMSSYVQRIHYIRAVQGELTRSINRLQAVKTSRVHISVPPKKTFIEDEDPPKASVILELRPGLAPTKSEINGIAHLVASAVEGLKVSQVTIVDTKGAFLHRPEDAGNSSVNSAMLEMQRSIETEYEKRIEDILAPVVGVGKIRAKVTAEIDPSRVNTTEETYDPDKQVVKSTVRNDESTQGSRPNPIGIPGSRSNLPGSEAQNPGVPVATTASEKNVQNTQYAYPRKVQVIDKPSGTIKRLTIAVVVDGHYKTGMQAGQENFVPLTEDELKRLQDIVANAVGYDKERRDSITVSSLPFKVAESLLGTEAEGGPWWQREEFVSQAVRNGVMGLLIVLFFFLIVRPFMKWALVSEPQAEIGAYPRTVAEIEAAQKSEGLMALTGKHGGSMLEDVEPLEKKEEEELKKRILDRMDLAPKKGFRIVQEWLDEDAGITAQSAEM